VREEANGVKAAAVGRAKIVDFAARAEEAVPSVSDRSMRAQHSGPVQTAAPDVVVVAVAVGVRMHTCSSHDSDVRSCGGSIPRSQLRKLVGS
jgi:hypothetical protein